MRQLLRGFLSFLRLSCLRNDSSVVIPGVPIDSDERNRNSHSNNDNLIFDSIKDDISSNINVFTPTSRTVPLVSIDLSGNDEDDSCTEDIGELLAKYYQVNDKKVEYEYNLRDMISENSFDYLTRSMNPDTMLRLLFGQNFDESIFSFNEDNILRTLYNMITYDSIHGPRPPSPFPNLESFLTYIFVECRDLRLIHVMLKFCQANPLFLRHYDQEVKKQNALVGVREILLLPFLIKIYQIDYMAFHSTLQLMGFFSMSHLFRYYKNRPDILDSCPTLTNSIEILKRIFQYYNENDHDEDNFWSEEYVNEQVY